MRKLLLFFAMLCVSVGAWADVNIWNTTWMSDTYTTEDDRVGIYGLEEGDLAAILDGTFSGNLYLKGRTATPEEARTAIVGAKVLKLGDDSGVLNQADINALSAFTALEYLDVIFLDFTHIIPYLLSIE